MADELLALRRLKRRVEAVVGYYTDDDLAAHLTASYTELEQGTADGVIRPVWINHKLVQAFADLRKELFPDG